MMRFATHFQAGLHWAGANIGPILIGGLCWVALNIFVKPIMALRERRHEALEVGERYAYVGLHGEPSDEYSKRALAALNDAANALRSYARERSLATRLYCWMRGYDVNLAWSALLGLAQAARGEYVVSEIDRRLTLHALLVALGATHHLTSEEVALAKAEIARWHDRKSLQKSQANQQ